MQHQPRGALLAVAGLTALVVVLVATPDVAAFVFLAWVFVVAGVLAVAFGVAHGFRHQARLEQRVRGPRYVTLDGVSREAEQIGDTVIAARQVSAVDGNGLASDERRVG